MWFDLIQVICWGVNTILSFVGFCLSSYITKSHHDYKKDHITPEAMSEVLRSCVLYEYFASWAPFYCLTQCWHPYWVYLLYVPIWCYNIKCFNAKEHVNHFITKGEY
jgi:hypothetical protein